MLLFHGDKPAEMTQTKDSGRDVTQSWLPQHQDPLPKHSFGMALLLGICQHVHAGSFPGCQRQRGWFRSRMGCLEPGVPIPSCHGLLLHPGHHFCTCERDAGCCEVEQIHVLRTSGTKCWENEQQQGRHSPPAHPESLQSFAVAVGRDCGKPLSSLENQTQRSINQILSY